MICSGGDSQRRTIDDGQIQPFAPGSALAHNGTGGQDMQKLVIAFAVVLSSFVWTSELSAQTPPGGPNLESSGHGLQQPSLRMGLQIRSDMKRGEVLARGNRVDLNNDGVLQENE